MLHTSGVGVMMLGGVTAVRPPPGPLGADQSAVLQYCSPAPRINLEENRNEQKLIRDSSIAKYDRILMKFLMLTDP